MRRYEYVISVYYRYLQEIELEFRKSQADQRAALPQLGIYLRQGDLPDAINRGVVRAERGLALYFLFLYPAVTLLAAVLTVLVTSHIVSPPSFG
jgi:hypothetical protein